MVHTSSASAGWHGHACRQIDALPRGSSYLAGEYLLAGKRRALADSTPHTYTWQQMSYTWQHVVGSTLRSNQYAVLLYPRINASKNVT